MFPPIHLSSTHLFIYLHHHFILLYVHNLLQAVIPLLHFLLHLFLLLLLLFLIFPCLPSLSPPHLLFQPNTFVVPISFSPLLLIFFLPNTFAFLVFSPSPPASLLSQPYSFAFLTSTFPPSPLARPLPPLLHLQPVRR